MISVMQLFCVLWPGIWAAVVWSILRKKRPDGALLAVIICAYGLGVFWIMNGVEYLRGWRDFNWTEFTGQFLLKYCVVTVVLTAVLAVVLGVIRKYMVKGDNS